MNAAPARAASGWQAPAAVRAGQRVHTNTEDVPSQSEGAAEQTGSLGRGPNGIQE